MLDLLHVLAQAGDVEVRWAPERPAEGPAALGGVEARALRMQPRASAGTAGPGIGGGAQHPTDLLGHDPQQC